MKNLNIGKTFIFQDNSRLTVPDFSRTLILYTLCPNKSILFLIFLKNIPENLLSDMIHNTKPPRI